MNLNKLEAFILVVERKSFSEAALALKSSQPAVSLKIKSLEEELGMELIDRSMAILQPTPAGMSVYKAAKEISQRWKVLGDELSSYNGTLTGTLTLGASTIPGTYLLPQRIKKFRELHPKVDIKIEIGDSKAILDKLLNHQIDAGIVGLHQENNKIQFRQFASDSLVLIAPAGHPLADSSFPDFNEIKKYDFVLREEGSGTKKEMEEFLAQQGYSLTDLKSAVSIESTEAIIAAVEAGLGISFVSKLAASPAVRKQQIKIIDSVPPFQRNFYFTTLKEAENRPIIQELAVSLFAE